MYQLLLVLVLLEQWRWALALANLQALYWCIRAIVGVYRLRQGESKIIEQHKETR